MPVISVEVGPKRVWVTAKNDSDALGDLCCLFVLERVQALLAGTTLEQLRSWAAQHVPAAGEMFAALEAGCVLPREVPIGEFPVDPLNAVAEVEIVGHILTERNRPHAVHI